MPMIVGAIAAAIIVSEKDSGVTKTRLADSNAQITSAYYVRDVQGAQYVTTTNVTGSFTSQSPQVCSNSSPQPPGASLPPSGHNPSCPDCSGQPPFSCVIGRILVDRRYESATLPRRLHCRPDRHRIDDNVQQPGAHLRRHHGIARDCHHPPAGVRYGRRHWLDTYLGGHDRHHVGESGEHTVCPPCRVHEWVSDRLDQPAHGAHQQWRSDGDMHRRPHRHLLHHLHRRYGNGSRWSFGEPAGKHLRNQPLGNATWEHLHLQPSGRSSGPVLPTERGSPRRVHSSVPPS